MLPYSYRKDKESLVLDEWTGHVELKSVIRQTFSYKIGIRASFVSSELFGSVELNSVFCQTFSYKIGIHASFVSNALFGRGLSDSPL